MKAILWKELREHARWIPLGLIPILVILILQWRSNELILATDSYGRSPILSLPIGIVACGVATCLGLLQSRSDQRPAARALLLHRGITADAVFRGKLLGGVLLYATAVLVPLLGMAMFIACVGIEHRAASPGVLLPAALISVAAFSCWLASLLVVQRDAWYLGSRLSPGVTAALAVFGCGSIMYEVPWLAILIVVMTLVALLAAARSVFVSVGQIASGAGRVGVALSVVVSLFAISTCLMSIVESYRTQSFYSSGEAAARQHVVEFGPDGRPWLTRVNHTWKTGDRKLEEVAEMLPGKSVADQFEPVEDSWKPLRKWSPYSYGYATYDPNRSLGGRFVAIGTASIRTDANDVLHRTWVFDAKRDVILVYRTRSRTRFQLEATVFPPAAVGSFGHIKNLGPTDAAGSFTLVSSTGVYRVPGSGVEVETIYAIPKSSSFVGSALPTRSQVVFPNTTFIPQTDSLELVLRLDDRIVFFANAAADAGPTARPVGPFQGLTKLFVNEVRLPDELAKAVWMNIAVDPVNSGSYLVLVQDPFRYEERVDWFRFDDQGRIVEQHQYKDATVTAVAENGKAAVAFVPPVAFAYGVVVIAIENDDGLQAAWGYVRLHPTETAILFALAMLQPIVGVPLAFWGARRRGLGKRTTWLWLCWAFWFGPYGSLAIFAVYPRLTREPCGACHHVTRIDLANCEHCGHSLDDMPPTGREIFERREVSPTLPTQTATI